jgi:hypothetical protein
MLEVVNVINRHMSSNVGDGLDKLVPGSVAAELALGEGVTGEFQDAAYVQAQVFWAAPVLLPICEMFLEHAGVYASPGKASYRIGNELLNWAQLIVCQALIDCFGDVITHDGRPFLVGIGGSAMAYLRSSWHILQAHAVYLMQKKKLPPHHLMGDYQQMTGIYPLFLL